MPRNKVQEQFISTMDEIFPGVRKLIESKRMDKEWQISREQELERRRVLHQQSIELQRLRRKANGQLTLPIFGTGLAKKLAQNEIGSLPLKGMKVK